MDDLEKNESFDHNVPPAPQVPVQHLEEDGNVISVGDSLDLMRLDPTLKRLGVGVGWDIISYNANDIDFDVSVFLLGSDNKTRDDDDFVFYNAPRALEGAVVHNGDSRTGAGDGDDESVSLNLEGIPFTAVRLAFAITIYKSFEKEQDLNSSKNCYIRLFNEETSQEFGRFLLDDAFKDNTNGGCVVAYLDREGPKWHFRPRLDFAARGLGEIAEEFGIIVGQE
jgi:tellurium resistance protein TerD